LRSWGKAAVVVGVTNPLRNPIEIGVTKITNEGWAAWVWAAYLKRHENKPIARATLERLTGVPERTQRAYETEVGVENQANYATEKEPIAEERDGYFWYYGQPKKRLGNSRIIHGVERCKRGRTKEHNREIWAASSLWDGSTQKNRLYFYGPHKAQALNKTLRLMRKSNQPHHARPNMLYMHVCNALGVGLWEALLCN
jgi:spore cortex formation protein SpoVR/YcgB (stage V sporulation)